MEDELVTIAVFDSHLGVIAARDALRDEAIECFVPQMLGDKDTRQKHVTYPGILHESLQLQVGRPDVDRATAVLRQADLLGDRKVDYGEQPPSCPECESASTSEVPPGAIRRLAMLFFCPLLSFSRRWRCGDCGHKWRQ